MGVQYYAWSNFLVAQNASPELIIPATIIKSITILIINKIFPSWLFWSVQGRTVGRIQMDNHIIVGLVCCYHALGVGLFGYSRFARKSSCFSSQNSTWKRLILSLIFRAILGNFCIMLFGISAFYHDSAAYYRQCAVAPHKRNDSPKTRLGVPSSYYIVWKRQE